YLHRAKFLVETPLFLFQEPPPFLIIIRITRRSLCRTCLVACFFKSIHLFRLQKLPLTSNRFLLDPDSSRNEFIDGFPSQIFDFGFSFVDRLGFCHRRLVRKSMWPTRTLGRSCISLLILSGNRRRSIPWHGYSSYLLIRLTAVT